MIYNSSFRRLLASKGFCCPHVFFLLNHSVTNIAKFLGYSQATISKVRRSTVCYAKCQNKTELPGQLKCQLPAVETIISWGFVNHKDQPHGEKPEEYKSVKNYEMSLDFQAYWLKYLTKNPDQDQQPQRNQ